MPKTKITFLPSRKTVEYESGSLPYQGEGFRESLLDIALHGGVEMRHICGGICACITCHVIVQQGDDRLSPMEADEENRIFRIPSYTLHSRLACRAVVRPAVPGAVPGEVVVQIPEA